MSGEGLESGDWLERSRAIKLENGAFLEAEVVAGNFGYRKSCDWVGHVMAYVIGSGGGIFDLAKVYELNSMCMWGKLRG